MALAGCYWWIGKDNERLDILNHQLKANCQSQRTSLAAYKKILICCTWRPAKVKAQVQDPMKRVIELQKLLNSHTQQVCWAKVRTLNREEWDKKNLEWEHLGWSTCKLCAFTFHWNFWAYRSGPAVCVKGNTLSLLEVEVEIFVLQNNRYSLQDLPLPPLLVTKPTTWIELQSNLTSEVLSL